MTLPIWFQNAQREIGVRELPENRGPAIKRYISMAHCGNEGDPWCAIFANAMLESAGVKGTRSALARSFEKNDNFIKLDAPYLGCIVTFWRGIKSQGYGHVGFYNGEQGDYISTLGGNESDMVRVEMLRKAGSKFGLSGYYSPKKNVKGELIMLPTLGKVPPLLKNSSGTGKVI